MSTLPSMSADAFAALTQLLNQYAAAALIGTSALSIWSGHTLHKRRWQGQRRVVYLLRNPLLGRALTSVDQHVEHLHWLQHWLTRLALLTLLAETVAKRALTARLPAPPLCMRSRPLQSAVPSHELDMRCAPTARRVPLPLLVEPGPPTCAFCQYSCQAAAYPLAAASAVSLTVSEDGYKTKTNDGT